MIRAKRPVAANTVQALASGRGLARRRIVSNVRTHRVGATRRVASRADTAGRKGFELQKYVRNRPSGRLRYRCSYSPPGELVDVGGTELHTLLITPTLRALRAGRPFVRRPVPPMYAARYSDEVAGVALVDSSHPKQFMRSPEGRAIYKRTRSPRRIQDPQPSPWLCAL